MYFIPDQFFCHTFLGFGLIVLFVKQSKILWNLNFRTYLSRWWSRSKELWAEWNINHKWPCLEFLTIFCLLLRLGFYVNWCKCLDRLLCRRRTVFLCSSEKWLLSPTESPKLGDSTEPLLMPKRSTTSKEPIKLSLLLPSAHISLENILYMCGTGIIFLSSVIVANHTVLFYLENIKDKLYIYESRFLRENSSVFRFFVIEAENGLRTRKCISLNWFVT